MAKCKALTESAVKGLKLQCLTFVFHDLGTIASCIRNITEDEEVTV